MDAWLWRWGNFLFVTSPDSIILTIWRLEQLERWLIWEEHPSPLVNAPGLSLPAELHPVGLLDCRQLRLELGLERQNLQRLTYMLAYCLVRDFVTFWGQSGSQFAGQLGTFGPLFKQFQYQKLHLYQNQKGSSLYHIHKSKCLLWATWFILPNFLSSQFTEGICFCWTWYKELSFWFW